MDVWAVSGWTALGALAGATGLLPGFHVNTLVALALAAAWTGTGPALAFVAAAASHAVFAVLPATYVGVPGDDTAIAVLPAQRLARDGRGREAVRIGTDAVLLATVLAIVVLLPAKWLLAEPVGLAGRIAGALPWILAASLLVLLLGERRKGWPRVAWAAGVQLAAGCVGLLASGMHMGGLIAMPSPQLLPLFAGLFGAAGLAASLASARPIPTAVVETNPTVSRRLTAAGVRGVAAGLCTVAVPGLTPAVAASIAYGRQRDDPRPALAALTATATAHQTLAVGLLFVTLHARTGLAAGVAGPSGVDPWTVGRPPPQLLDLLVAALLATLLAWWVVRRIERAVRRGLAWLPHRLPEWLALAFLVALVITLSGASGLALFATSATIGLLPIVLGTRRVHLVACVALPLLASQLGLTP
ncbi:MAG: tripartite tricarboxylate transporter permease [bacterium]